jgi:hypothetical protein
MGTISIRCSCGRTLKADDKYSGRKAKCSSCGARLVIPMPGNKQSTSPPTAEPAAGSPPIPDRVAHTPTDEAKTGNWRPGEKVPKTGTYKCLMCGPEGVMGFALGALFNAAGRRPSGVAASQSTSFKFFREGDVFTKCSNCAAIAADAGTPNDMTGWDFVSGEEVTPAAKSAPQPDMVYFECTRPPGDGKCSDDSCPCGFPGADIPRGSGYFYISKELVKMRCDALTIAELEKKVRGMQQRLGATMMMAGQGVFMPILMCELAAKKRGVNMEVAAADAKHYWKTGMAPLRPTPMAGEAGDRAYLGSNPPETKVACKVCGAPILRITAEKYGGRCVPCSRSKSWLNRFFGGS